MIMIRFSEMSEKMQKAVLELNHQWFMIQMGSFREQARYEKKALEGFNERFGTAFKTFGYNFYGENEKIYLR